jgi:hypothetical protein
MTLANAHALFCGLRALPSYLANLTIEDDERKALLAARRDIRTTLKAAASTLLAEDKYWKEGTVYRNSWRRRPAIEIKFMTQGSFAYGTLNVPAHVPHQEIDLDDGMYVPVDFLEDGQPALVAKALFDFVEEALTPMCTRKGWSVSKKQSCVRVKIWDGAHVDIPIYSVPRDKFEALREALMKAEIAFADAYTNRATAALTRLPADRIMLAQRDGSWVRSDPQELHDWVQGQRDRFGAVYIRLSRFFKGWRDYTWKKSALSSLCTMRAVAMALNNLDGFPTEERDDELVMEVAKQLPELFGGNISNPVLPELSLNNWTSEDRMEIVAQATALRDEMMSALQRTGDAEQVVKKLRSKFGSRIPYRPDAVKIASKIAAIQTAKPSIVAAPRVIASTSG